MSQKTILLILCLFMRRILYLLKIQDKFKNLTLMYFWFTNTLVEVLKKKTNSCCMLIEVDLHLDMKNLVIIKQIEPTPDGIVSAKPYIDRLLECLNITKIYLDGFEADDLIGTLAKKAEKEGFHVYMMTSDKDFAQLVSENIFMYRPGNKWAPTEVWGIKEVLEKFQIQKVSQVIDYLGMMGDAVDNIPGYGVGEDCINSYMNTVLWKLFYRNTHKIKGKLREKEEALREQGLFQKLATIDINVPIEFNENELFFQN